jgi:hypothetical protein
MFAEILSTSTFQDRYPNSTLRIERHYELWGHPIKLLSCWLETSARGSL